jgi:hypothetical protein
MLHSRWINGNLAFWETQQCRIIDAYGAGVVKYLNEFVALPLDNATWFPDDWKTFADNAGADIVSQPISVPGGVVQLSTGAAATDNDETYIQLGGAACITNAPFVIAGAAGAANASPLYFGARVKALEVADGGWFVGLAEEGAAVTLFMADNSAVMAAVDHVGFNILTATPAAWNITWRRGAGVVQTAAAVAVNAGDWHIFEFWYDGATSVTFWIDGVQSATVATTTAATFPYAEEMGPILGLKTGENVLKRLQVDWLRVVQFS